MDGACTAATTLRCRPTCTPTAIVGSGAGAGITADLLSAAGLRVLIIEEGPLRSSSHFRQLESDAYPSLYQDSASRKTADHGISILQGRCVGGSTTVNWTSSFRTPSATLAFWRERFALPELTDDALAPYFLQAEQRLHIGPWLAAPNANNQHLRDGAARLGIPAAAILRNVQGCWNLGSCGLGCPTNAKQSMLVTTIPAALDRGAVLWCRRGCSACRSTPPASRAWCASRWRSTARPRARRCRCAPATSSWPAARSTRRRCCCARGCLILRRCSGVAPSCTRWWRRPRCSTRTSPPGVAPHRPSTPTTLDTPQPIDGPLGYKLEAPPLHPVIAATTLAGFGAPHAAALRALPHTQALLALMRDGFHPRSVGGQVRLRSDGSPLLDYPLDDLVFDAARRAYLSMAEIQFAAGARSVTPVHELAVPLRSWAEAKDAIAALPQRLHATRVLSAHVMGGCAMAGTPDLGVVRADGRHWQLQALSVHDGSVFPTSIGANPQLSVYGLVTRLATGLAHALTGRKVAPGLSV